MVAKLLEPQLQYSDSEKDLSVMVNKVEGVRAGKQQILTCSLMIERDLMTGLTTMRMGEAITGINCSVEGKQTLQSPGLGGLSVDQLKMYLETGKMPTI